MLRIVLPVLAVLCLIFFTAPSVSGHTSYLDPSGQIFSSKPVPPYIPGDFNWTSKQLMPTGRDGLGAAVINGIVYAVGGDRLDTVGLAIVEAFDPASNTSNNWLSKAPMTYARNGLGLVEYKGKLYAIGGGNSGGLVNSIEEYNPVTDAWNVISSMATPRENFASVVVDGKYIVIGGNTSGGYTTSVEEYDLRRGKWTTKASLPGTARSGLSATVLNGKVYVMGGYNHTLQPQFFRKVYEYDPRRNIWAEKADLPFIRSALAAVSLNSRVYALGGFNGSTYLNDVDEYNPNTNTWTTKNSLNNRCYGLAATVVGTKVYVLGGYDGVAKCDRNEEGNWMPSL